MPLCPYCHDWEIENGHNFCGGCGAFVNPVSVGIGAFSTDDGPTPTLRLDNTGDDNLNRLYFVLLGEDSDGEEELCRINPDEADPETGHVVWPDPDRDFALSVKVARGHKPDGEHFAPNTLANGVFVQSGRKPVVHIIETLINCGTARLTKDDWYKVRLQLRNDGPPLALLGARLRIDSIPEAEDDPQDWGRYANGLLLPGQSGTFEAWLTKAELNALTRSRTTLSAQLELRINDNGQEAHITCPQRAKLFIAAPPAASIQLGNQLNARAGHKARFGAEIHNEGGMPLQVISLAAKVRGELVELELPLTLERAVQPGEEVGFEINPMMPSEEGRADFEISAKVKVIGGDQGGEVIEASKSTECSIGPADKAFTGWICVDFGTSESGAAFRLAPMDDDFDPPYPEMIDLGCVPLNSDPSRQRAADRKGRFFPTLIAEMQDGSFRTGEAAQRLLRAQERVEAGEKWPEGLMRPERTEREFKWRLTNDSGDGGARGAQLTTEYLKVIKERIENHPLIASAITNATRVIATRPTQFGDGQSECLRDAFTAAGFPDPTVQIFTDAKSLMAESWSPLQLLFEPFGLGAEDFAEKVVALDEKVYILPLPGIEEGGREKESAYALVCDIGAGSADFSAVEFAHDDGDCQLLRERASHTDTKFVGHRFADLITQAILKWLEDEWRGFEASDLTPGEFKRAVGGDISSSSRAHSLFQQAVQSLQFFPGILSQDIEEEEDFATDIRVFFREIEESGGGLSSNAEAKLLGLIDHHFGDTHSNDATGECGIARRKARKFLPLELQMPDGETVFIDASNIAALVFEVTRQFAETHASTMRDIVDNLREECGLNDYLAERKGDQAPLQFVRIIPSGRGAAFPLARELIKASIEELQRNGATYAALSPVVSKSITSWGALQFAWVIEDLDTEFVVDVKSRPIEVSLRTSRRPGGWRTLPFEPVLDSDGSTVIGKALAASVVSKRMAKFASRKDLQVEVGAGDGKTVVRPQIPAAVRDDQENWWLCAGRNARGEIKVRFVAAKTDFDALEMVSHDGGDEE